MPPAEDRRVGARLAESEETLRAIRSGEVDAITVTTAGGELVFSLSGAEQPYREMIEAMSEGAANVTPDGMVLYCNQRFADMAKTDLRAVMGSNLLAYFVPEDRTRITTALGKLRNHSGPCADAAAWTVNLCR